MAVRADQASSGGASQQASALSPAEVDAWRRRIRTETFANYHYEMGVAIEAEGDLGAALQAYRRALEIDPAMAAAHFRLIGILRVQGDIEGADSAQQVAAAAHSHYVGLGMLRDAQSLIMAGKEDAAFDLLVRAMAEDPGCGEAAAYYAAMLTLRGETAAADAAFNSITRPDPWIMRELAEQLYREGRTVYHSLDRIRALNILSVATRFDPEHAGILDYLAFALMVNGRIDDAGDVFKRVLELDPNHLNGNAQWVQYLIYRGDLALAETAFQAFKAHYPDNVLTSLTAGLLAMAQRRPEMAEAAFRQAFQQDPQYNLTIIGLGLLHLDAGRLDAALRCARIAISQNPDSAPAWLGMALTLDALGRGTDADHCYRRTGIAASPDLLKYFVRLFSWTGIKAIPRCQALGVLPAGPALSI